MVFLPIVQRELRVSSRKRGTMWVRLGGAFAALLIGSLGFAMEMTSGSAAKTGQTLFGVLTLLACLAALSIGLAFTSDSVSEEKREGTLGFLFLTDLRGYDVVAGKLLAAALRAFYMLLAAFPIIGITLLMGGVTGATFWKTCVALLNGLFVSLIAGVFVSSISREAQKAMLGTMLLMFVWAGAPYLIDALRGRTFFKLASPFFTFSMASRLSTTVFWESLLVTQAFAWSLFALSSIFAARTWHDKPDPKSSPMAALAHWLKYGSARRRARLRLKLMPVNPITWLSCRERWQAVSFWAIAVIMVGLIILIVAVNAAGVRAQVWAVSGVVMTLILYVGFASQACRFFTDARRNALLEVLLSTPLSGQEIIHGQWKAILRMFGPPLGLFLLWHFTGTVIAQEAGSGSNPFKSLGLALAHVLVIAVDVTALTWFGMWMGLISKTANAAAWKTLFFVQVLPWIALTFATGLMVGLLFVPALSRSRNATAWLQIVTGAVPIVGSLAIDWWLYRFARRKLFSELRQRAAAPLGR